MAKMSIRVDIEGGDRIGPGKIALLENIGETGSISAAGRAMAMSYKRAWDLIADMNAMFREPVVTSQTGGKDGGGAKLTEFGQELIEQFRAMEKAALEAAKPHLKVIDAARSRKR